ncbi:hypothetical protein FS837_008144 [Tulasnella sp. UAMH 9824]|nr:hypothetical protein FS837_008144 [Tulasnella sp. UAMH 9824]
MQVKWRELIDLEPLLNIWLEIGIFEENQEGWGIMLTRQPQALDWFTIYRYMSQVQTLRFLSHPMPGAFRRPEIIFLLQQLYNAARRPDQDQILCNISPGIGLRPRLFPSLRTVEWECLSPFDLHSLGMVVLSSPEIVRVVIKITFFMKSTPESWDQNLFVVLEHAFAHATSIQHLEIDRLPISNPDPELQAMTSTAGIIRYIIRAEGLRHLVLPAEALACNDLFGVCCLSSSLQSLQFGSSIAASTRVPDRPPTGDGLADFPSNLNLKCISATTRIIQALLSQPMGICAGLEQLFVVEDPEVDVPAHTLPVTLAFFGASFPLLKVLWLQTTLVVPDILPGSRLNTTNLGRPEKPVMNAPVLAALEELKGLEELHVELKFTYLASCTSAEPIPPLDFMLSDDDWEVVSTFWPKLKKLWYSCVPAEGPRPDRPTINRMFEPYSILQTEGDPADQVATIKSILTLLSTCHHLQSITIPFNCREEDCKEHTFQAAGLPGEQRSLDGLEIGLNFADVDAGEDDPAGIVGFWTILMWGVRNARFTGIPIPSDEWPGAVAIPSEELMREMQWREILDRVEISLRYGRAVPPWVDVQELGSDLVEMEMD